MSPRHNPQWWVPGPADASMPMPGPVGAPVVTAVGALQIGDVIAVPFEGYGDILSEITSIEERDTVRVVTASDGQYTYINELPLSGNVLWYPATMKGQVRR